MHELMILNTLHPSLTEWLGDISVQTEAWSGSCKEMCNEAFSLYSCPRHLCPPCEHRFLDSFTPMCKTVLHASVCIVQNYLMGGQSKKRQECKVTLCMFIQIFLAIFWIVRGPSIGIFTLLFQHPHLRV